MRRLRAVLERAGIVRHRGVGPYVVVHRNGLYRVWEETQLRRLLPYLGVDCVFDVGANTGQYATMLRQECGYTGLIVSFEPNPDMLSVLRERARHDPRWLVEDVALSTTDGHQTFHVMRGAEFSSLSEPRHDEVARFTRQNVVSREVTVRTETLATSLERLRATHGFARPFLKLDTQGFDVAIVRAGAGVMPQFVGLQSELAVKKLYEDSVDFRDALREYQSLGFDLSAIVPNNAGHFPLLVEADAIMIRSDLASGLAPGLPSDPVGGTTTGPRRE